MSTFIEDGSEHELALQEAAMLSAPSGGEFDRMVDEFGAIVFDDDDINTPGLTAQPAVPRRDDFIPHTNYKGGNVTNIGTYRRAGMVAVPDSSFEGQRSALEYRLREMALRAYNEKRMLRPQDVISLIDSGSPFAVTGAATPIAEDVKAAASLDRQLSDLRIGDSVRRLIFEAIDQAAWDESPLTGTPTFEYAFELNESAYLRRAAQAQIIDKLRAQMVDLPNLSDSAGV